MDASENDRLNASQELAAAIERMVKGVRDEDAMRIACERMDRMREAMQRRVGIVEVAVDLIREARGSE